MRFRTISLAVVLELSLAAGCGEPPADCFRSEGCAAPDPKGIIAGTVLYAGPRPSCERDDTGALMTPRRPLGRAVMTLFEYDNPPPPSGSASSAANLLTIPGSTLFGGLTESDCMPAAPTDEERAVVIMRSAPFTWPDIELGHGTDAAGDPAGTTYQIRGFYDDDGDFNPFFSASNLPTRGDLAGGAFEDASASPLTFMPVAFGGASVRPSGEVVSGIAITLGAVVRTERPLFTAEWIPLESDEVIPATTDATERERLLYEMTEFKISLLAATDARYFGDDSMGIRGALDAAGVDLDLDAIGYSWFVQAVDADGDGVGDLHPILGSGGVPWLTPIVILQRYRTALEIAAGIPSVLLIASVKPSQVLIKKVFRPTMDIVVAPVAAMQLNPTSDECTADLAALGATAVPVLAPGNLTTSLERIPVDCQEIPSGEYNINVLHGIAGGAEMVVPRAISDACATVEGVEQCIVWTGGSLSGQAWSIPNELGDARQLCTDEELGAGTCAFATDAMSLAAEQGVDARFLVTDPSPADVGQGDARCDRAIDPTTLTERDVMYLPIPDSCCAAILHLCDVPLCDTGEITRNGVTATVRLAPTEVNGGVANCVPFAMPETCCDGAPSGS